MQNENNLQDCMQRMCSTFCFIQLLLTFVSFVNLEKKREYSSFRLDVLSSENQREILISVCMHNFHSVQAETSKQGSFHDKLNMEFKKGYNFYHVFCGVVTLLVIQISLFWLAGGGG